MPNLIISPSSVRVNIEKSFRTFSPDLKKEKFFFFFGFRNLIDLKNYKVLLILKLLIFILLMRSQGKVEKVKNLQKKYKKKKMVTKKMTMLLVRRSRTK